MGLGLSSRYEINGRIDGKTVLITGCNTGIGKYTAQELYRVGGRVIMACRNISKAEKAAEEIRAKVKVSDPEGKHGELIIKQLDLASMESIRRCARDVIESETQLNILINNAGVLLTGNHKETTEEGFEITFGTNHLGHFYLTYLLLPKLLISTPARIVTLSSILHKVSHMQWDDLNMEKNYGGWSAYARSKLANVLFSRELSRRLEGTGVSIYCVDPGPVKTDMGHGILQDYIGRGFWYRFIGKLYELLPCLNSTEEGAATTLYCALDESLAKETGFYYSSCARTSVGYRGNSDSDAQKLWVKSLRLLDLQDLELNKIPQDS